MKKTNTSVTKITVFFIFLLVLVVGYYAYLSGTHRTEQQEAVMSEIDTALSRNLENNYPSTPKEVVKYYNDLMKCFYNEDCTEEELQELGASEKKLCIVTDSRVDELYGAQVAELLEGKCRKIVKYAFPAGEENKNLETVKDVYRYLIEEGFDRKDMLLALGGGVTGDLTGFVAATYLRGIDFVQIPTTLLAQVDSSIGGKTGVDFDCYKNMVGAFHMPKLVYANVSALKTLPPEQFSAGMGEVIKHGLIRDQEYYEWILENKEAVRNRELSVCRRLICGSNRIKRQVVEADPTEQNERAVLNFGHTLGHAVEKLKDFSMLHGHCVALGALAALDICVKRGMVPEAEADRYRETMEYFDMPVSVGGLTKEAVVAATKNDKKMEAGVIKFILLDRLGHAYVDRTVTDEEMKDALDAVMERPGEK